MASGAGSGSWSADQRWQRGDQPWEHGQVTHWFLIREDTVEVGGLHGWQNSEVKQKPTGSPTVPGSDGRAEGGDGARKGRMETRCLHSVLLHSGRPGAFGVASCAFRVFPCGFLH